MNEYLVICYPCTILKPRIRSFRDNCKECGREVWRAKSSPAAAKAICFPCAIQMELFKQGIEPPTKEQLHDIIQAKFN